MIDVDDVCTHEDLAAEIGGTDELANVLPASYEGSSLAMRELALRDVLKALSRRTPPIRESDIRVRAELRDAVAYGALERIYRAAMTSPDSAFGELRKMYERRFQAECLGLTPTVSDGARGTAFTISMERR